MVAFEQGGPQFGARECKVGKWVGDGTYTPQATVKGVRVLGYNLQTSQQDLDGDDATLATAITIKKAQVTLEMAHIQFDVISILSGNPEVDSGSLTRLMVTTRKPPYVGIAGRAEAAEGDGDTHLFGPKCKMSGGFEVKIQLDQFSIPSLTLDAVADDNFVDANNYPVIFDMDQHATATAVALPPTGMG